MRKFEDYIEYCCVNAVANIVSSQGTYQIYI